jgi:transcription elongation factor Elf1
MATRRITRRVTIKVKPPSFTITCPHCGHAYRNIGSYRTGTFACNYCGKPVRL